jgi:hypothetical protein
MPKSLLLVWRSAKLVVNGPLTLFASFITICGFPFSHADSI